MSEFTCECGEECNRRPDDWVIGWDANTADWFLVRENGEELSEHATHNDALRAGLAADPYAAFFHEANGGGCLGEFDPHDSPFYDDDTTP